MGGWVVPGAVFQGGAEGGAAAERFAAYAADVERRPQDWATWFRLGIAYDDAGDRRRARELGLDVDDDEASALDELEHDPTDYPLARIGQGDNARDIPAEPCEPLRWRNVDWPLLGFALAAFAALVGLAMLGIQAAR